MIHFLNSPDPIVLYLGRVASNDLVFSNPDLIVLYLGSMTSNGLFLKHPRPKSALYRQHDLE